MNAPPSPIPAELAEDNGTDDERIKRKWLKVIAQKGSTNFPCLMLYNSIRETGSATAGIDDFSSVHANLMALHGFMAGFQYFVLDGTAPDIGSELSLLDNVTLTVRAIGFSCSLAGTIISLIAMEYLKSIELEGIGLQVEGCLKFATFFRHSDELAVIACAGLFITSNLLVWDFLPIWLCIILNTIASSGALYILHNISVIILGRQKYGGGRHLYEDEDYKKAILRNSNLSAYLYRSSAVTE